MAVYFVHKSGSSYGPYTAEQVRAMFAAGKLGTNSLIFEKGGAQKWLPLINFQELTRPPKKKARALATTPSVTSIPVNAGEIEKTIWEGRPSAWKLLGKFIEAIILFVLMMVAYVFLRLNVSGQVGHILIYGILCISMIFVFWLLWEWIKIKTKKWSLSNERITRYEGVFNRRMNTMELYRIKDMSVRKPILYRLVGHGFLILIASDVTDKVELIGPITKPDDLYQMIRKYTERQRQRRGVREVDFIKM